MKIILHGYYAEYSLSPLEHLLTAAGHEVFLLNHSPDSINMIEFEKLIAGACLVITSCHFLSDKIHLKKIYPNLPANTVTPIEIFRRKSKDCKMIYVPHDLIEPIKWIEWPMSYIFDRILLPYPSLVPNYAKEKCKVADWIKEINLASEKNYNSIFLPSNVAAAFSTFGKEAFYNRYKYILSSGIPVKLPEWPGLDELETYLLQQGVSVIPATTDSFALIRGSTNIITNTLSSVAREASLLSKNVYFTLDQWTTELELLEFISSTPSCHITKPSFDWMSLNKNSDQSKSPTDSLASHKILTAIQEVMNLHLKDI